MTDHDILTEERAIESRMRKGTITPISIPAEQLEFLQEYLKSNMAPTNKRSMITKIAGGNCCICRELPSVIVTYKLEDATLRERYCDNCLSNVYMKPISS